MERLTQIAVSVPNRPGILAEVCRELSTDRINIIAILVPEMIGAGTLRIIPDDLQKACKVFDRLGHPYATEEVLSLKLANEPGALGEIAETLGIARIGIEFLYCTTDEHGRAERVVLSPTDMTRAESLLRQYAELTV